MEYESTYPANGFACDLKSLAANQVRGHPRLAGAQLLQGGRNFGPQVGYVMSNRHCTKVTVNGTDRITGYYRHRHNLKR